VQIQSEHLILKKSVALSSTPMKISLEARVK
jgi:hypothetical protein